MVVVVTIPPPATPQLTFSIRASLSRSSSWAPPQPPSHSLSAPRAPWLKPRSWGTTRAPRSQAACIRVGLPHPRLWTNVSEEGYLWGLECVWITSPQSPLLPAPLWSLSSQLLSVPGLSSSMWCVSLPASLGSPEALPLWPETSNVPKPGSRPGSPFTPPSSHFPELTRPCFFLLPRPNVPTGRKSTVLALQRVPQTQPLPRNPSGGFWAGTLFPCSWPLLTGDGGRKTAGSLQGCHYPAGRGFPSLFRLQDAFCPRSPIPPSMLSPQDANVWDTYEEHACGSVCSPRRPASGIRLPYIFLEACRPGPL